MLLGKLELFKISYFSIIPYFRKFNYRHKISPLVLYVFVLGYFLGYAKKPFGIVLLCQLDVKRLVFLVFEELGYFKPNKLVFAVNLGLASPFLEFFKIIFG